MTRKELVGLILPAVCKFNPQETVKQNRDFCERQTDAELQETYELQVKNGHLVELTPEEEAKIRNTAEREATFEVQQLKINRDIFQELCRKHRLLFCEANFKLLVGISYDKLGQFIETNKQKFAAAEPEDANAWDREDRQVLAEKIASYRVFKTYSGGREVQDPVARQNYVKELNKLSIAELAAILARVERERRMRELPVDELREQAYQEAAQQNLTPFESELARGFERDVLIAKMPPLPKTWLGQTLDGNFLRRASKETLKSIMRRHGASQITARLHSIKTVGNYVFEGEI